MQLVLEPFLFFIFMFVCFFFFTFSGCKTEDERIIVLFPVSIHVAAPTGICQTSS